MAKESKKGKRFVENKKKTGISRNKIIIVFIILIIIVGIGIIIIKNQNNAINTQKQEKQISQQILQDKEFEGRPVKNISLDIQENASYLKCDIENNGEQIEKQSIYIVFVKEDNSEIAKFSYMLDEIPANEIGRVKLATTTNLIDAYDFYLEIKENEENPNN